jgi:hypothetical protein
VQFDRVARHPLDKVADHPSGRQDLLLAIVLAGAAKWNKDKARKDSDENSQPTVHEHGNELQTLILGR